MILFANNATANLASSISPSSTTITVATGKGALYPAPTSPNVFVATLQEGTTIEIVTVTNRVGDVMTVTRAQEGTAAGTFTAAAVFDVRITAGDLYAFPQLVGAVSGSSFANGASISGGTLSFGPADATNPGLLTASAQTIAGAKTFTGLITASGGLSLSGSLTAGSLSVTSGDITSAVPNGSSAVGFTMNTSIALAASGAKLLSLQTAGVEKMSVSNTGYLSMASGASLNYLDLTNGSAIAVSGTGMVRFRNNAGVAELSVNGGAYTGFGGQQLLDWVSVKAFGAVGDGSHDDTTAFQNAINATLDTDGITRKPLYIPAGTYLITATLTQPASLGWMIIGDGRWTSTIQFKPTTPNADMWVINSSSFGLMRDFTVMTYNATPGGKIFNFDYNPVVNASAGHRIQDIQITCQDAHDGYDIGIYWSATYGNNSEVNYFGVQMDRFKTAAVSMPGTQQKTHEFFGCDFNGLWDGVSTNSTGGQYCIVSVGGAFNVWGGTMGNVRKCAFSLQYPTDPCIIEGVDCEGAYRFAENGHDPASSIQSLTIRYNRIEHGTFPCDTDGIIQYAGIGPLEVIGNSFFQGDGTHGYPQIRLSAGAPFVDVKVVGNNFDTVGSVAHSAVIMNTGSVNYGQAVEVSGNVFADSSGVAAYRNEVLDAAYQFTAIFGNKKQQVDLWSIDATNFTAATPSQTIALQANWPKGTLLKEFMCQLYNYFIHTSGQPAYMRVGMTSGGDELLQDCLITSNFGDNAIVFGRPGSAERGTLIDAGGYLSDYQNASTIYITIRCTSGNVGTGTATNFTRGWVMFHADYSQMARFLT